MTATVLPLRQRFYTAVIGDILDLTLAQPHQVLLSTGSVALMAQFAAHGGVVEPLVGYCIAGGVEWAYLRGLASNAKAPTGWATALNWSAFAIVVLWGVLWVALQYKAIHIEGVKGGWAWALAAAHVVPVAWLSLCAAMTHSAAVAAQAQETAARRKAEAERELWQQQADAEREQRLRAARDAIELEAEKRRAELATWAEAQRVKAEMRGTMPASKNAANARPASINAAPQVCPKCGAELDRPQWLAARRWGRCAACKDA